MDSMEAVQAFLARLTNVRIEEEFGGSDDSAEDYMESGALALEDEGDPDN